VIESPPRSKTLLSHTSSSSRTKIALWQTPGSDIAGKSRVFETAPDRSSAERKLTLLRRSGLFGEDTKGAVICRASPFDDLRQAFRLVHDVYLSFRYIHAEPSGMRVRLFETLLENATFVAKKDGQVVGVLSIVGDSPDLGLPTDGVFRDELNTLRRAGTRLCELTNQAVVEEFKKSAVPTELMRCALAHGVMSGYQQGIAVVCPKHNRFYDMMGFRQVGQERSYSQTINDPVVALSLDFSRFRHVPREATPIELFFYYFLSSGNPYRCCVARWAEQAQTSFLNAKLLSRLFFGEWNLLAECTLLELQILQMLWGGELFEEVLDPW